MRWATLLLQLELPPHTRRRAELTGTSFSSEGTTSAYAEKRQRENLTRYL